MILSCRRVHIVIHSMINLAMAINESTEKKLKLCQIYDWIKTNFPYYKVRITFSVDETIL